MNNRLNKYKKCRDEQCENMFLPYKTTQKYCSYKCSAKHHKPLKRTPMKTKPKNAFEKEFEKRKKEITQRLINTWGKVICEKCGIDKSISFSTHHIIFRSEKPNHEHLNSLENLIHLCYKCHENFHKEKKSRNYLIEERRLWLLFDRIWGFEDYPTDFLDAE